VALPRKNRLTVKRDINDVFKRGRTVKGSFLFIKFLDNQRGYPRFVFIIPSKYVSLAVDRNKIKRMFSGEIMKSFILKHGYDMVVMIYKKAERGQFSELMEELRDVLRCLKTQNTDYTKNK